MKEIIGLMVNGQALASEHIKLSHRLLQQVQLEGYPPSCFLRKAASSYPPYGPRVAIPKGVPILGAETRVQINREFNNDSRLLPLVGSAYLRPLVPANLFTTMVFLPSPLVFFFLFFLPHSIRPDKGRAAPLLIITGIAYPSCLIPLATENPDFLPSQHVLKTIVPP